MALQLSFLSLSPRVRICQDRLAVSTGWLPAILILGLWTRRMTVWPTEQKLEIDDRILFFWHRRRRYRFRDIEAVTYGYSDEAGWANYTNFGHDSIDTFRVGLRLHDDRELHLFSFHGAGTFEHDGTFPDWFFASEILFDVSGTQEQNSRQLVDMLCKLVGASVVPPRY